MRRLINQGFFKKLFIGPDGSVEQYELTEPFATLLTDGKLISINAPQAAQDTPDQANLRDQDTTVPEQAGVYDALEYGNDVERRTWPAGFWSERSHCHQKAPSPKMISWG